MRSSLTSRRWVWSQTSLCSRPWPFIASLCLVDWLIVLGFNDTSTLVGHFLSSHREREKRDRGDRKYSREDEREGHGGKKENKNENEETVVPYIIIVQIIFYFLWDHWAHPGYFENRIPLKPVLGGVCSLVNYSFAYEETPSNRFSWFCVFFVFPNAILFYFYFTLL